MTEYTEPRIYVASLTDYNAGRLHGTWIDCDGLDADDIAAQVSAMLAKSPEAATAWARRNGVKAEEWAIHDYEGFPIRLSEWESFESVARLAAIAAEHENTELVRAAFEAADDDIDRADEILRDAVSVYDSWTEAAEDYADAFGLYAAAAEVASDYLTVDIDAIRRDMPAWCGYHEYRGTVYYFHGLR